MTESMTVNGVSIRLARPDDLRWVADLMDFELSKYYKANHRARAAKMFEQDARHNHNEESSGAMLVAERSGAPVGFIHLTRKRPNAMKISPLIVAMSSRYDYGVGTKCGCCGAVLYGVVAKL